MAGLFKRNGIYYAKFYAGRNPTRVSLKTDDPRLAKAKLSRIEMALAQGNDSPLPSKTPIEQAITAYVEHMAASKSPRSALRDTRLLRQVFGPICSALDTNRRQEGQEGPQEPQAPRRKKDDVSPISAHYL